MRKLLLIIFSVLSLICIGTYSLYASVKIRFHLFPGTEQVYVFSEFDRHKCFTYNKYIIVTKYLEGSVGSDIFVKQFEWNKGHYDCPKVINQYDFKIENEWAEYFKGIYRHYLFIDSGTGPDGRHLIIYDLNAKKKVFKSEYSDPTFINEQGILSFWTTSKILANEENCEKYKEYTSGGLGVAIDKKMLLNLNNLKLSETSETRCSARQ